MSPAVAAGDAEDTRCDIYSFGALLYEMLTGHPPYKGRGTREILDKILAGPPKPITSLNPGVDRGLVAVAEGAMARELRDRYADMRDVLKDLQRIKENKSPLRPHGMATGMIPKLWQAGRIPKNFWIPACLVVMGILGWTLRPKENLEIIHMKTNLALICLVVSGILALWILVSPQSLKRGLWEKWKLIIAAGLVVLCAILGQPLVKIAALLCGVGLVIVAFLKLFLDGRPIKQVFSEQSAVRLTRSIMLLDLTQMRERFIRARDTVCRGQPALQINPVKSALDAIDQFKLELEGSPMGDYSLKGDDQAVIELEKLRQEDSQIQSALKELVERQIAALAGISSSDATQRLIASAEGFVRELDELQQKLRERQRFATTLKS
jgi:hypothetical protein